jgi:hypothetical protein
MHGCEEYYTVLLGSSQTVESLEFKGRVPGPAPEHKREEEKNEGQKVLSAVSHKLS